MFVTILVRLTDIVAPLFLILRAQVGAKQFIQLHITNSKGLLFLLVAPQ